MHTDFYISGQVISSRKKIYGPVCFLVTQSADHELGSTGEKSTVFIYANTSWCVFETDVSY